MTNSSVLWDPQAATLCELYINSDQEGSHICMGGSNILMFWTKIATYYVICGEKFALRGYRNSPFWLMH